LASILSRWYWLVLGLLFFVVLSPGLAAAQAPPPGELAGPRLDPEGCLLCHRFPGLSRLDRQSGELRLFFTSERHYLEREGPHARLRCTDCHSREEVRTLPHERVTPVDCTQSCHLVGASGVLTQFSHKGVAERIEKSVHAADVLKTLPFAQPLLRPGQSACLYCHDQPVFRDAVFAERSHRGIDTGARCETCHTAELPVDTKYYVRHIAGRQLPARPVLETARVCAACHSDAAVMKETGLHDAVTSYFRSFHGKASLLGDHTTAACVDCHRSEGGDVHLMLSAEDPSSRTHPDQRGLTCRSSECHANAVPELSAASVHLRVDPQSRSPEYLVLLAFVLLIAFELGMYYVLTILEMIAVAFRKQTPEQRHLIALSAAVAAHPEGRKRLERLTPHQRVQHWLLVTLFTALVITGVPMKFATIPAFAVLAKLFGGLAGARVIHRIAGALLFVLTVYHIGYAIWGWITEVRRRHSEDPTRGWLWTAVLAFAQADIVPRPSDLVHFVKLFPHLLGFPVKHPHRGKYHFSQKIEYWAVMWGMIVIGISGLLLWNSASSPEYLGGRALNFAYIVHSYEAFLAIMYIVVAHLFAVLAAPAIVPLSMGAITGQVPAKENAQEHSGYVLQVAKELGIEVETPPARNAWTARALLGRAALILYAMGQIVAILLVCYWTTTMLWADATGPRPVVNVGALPLRLDAKTLQPDAADGQHSERYQRGPLAHFHVYPPWFHADPANTCTSGGCHEVLPHGEQKSDRAFLNMHTTFVDCLVCHADGAFDGRTDGAELTWLSLQDRSIAPIPAVLRLSKMLASDVPTDERELKAFDAALQSVLAEAVAASEGDPELKRWAVDLETARVGGVLYASHIAEMRRNIHLHGHGEYGAKLGQPGHLRVLDAEQQRAAEELATLTEDTPARTALVETVHRGLERPEVLCHQCHDADEVRVDYEALGHSPARAAALRSNDLSGYINAIENKEPFFLPQVLDPTDGPFGRPEDGERGEDGGGER